MGHLNRLPIYPFWFFFWQDNIDAAEALEALKAKAKAVDWRSNGRKEFCAIFARSFKKEVKEKTCFSLALRAWLRDSDYNPNLVSCPGL